MQITYEESGLAKTTSTVHVEWPDGVCWLVYNEFGVIGAVIAHEDDSWESVYEKAVDEIARDWDADADADEIDEAIEDGLASHRGGIPTDTSKGRKTIVADTQYLGIRRNVRG